MALILVISWDSFESDALFLHCQHLAFNKICWNHFHKKSVFTTSSTFSTFISYLNSHSQFNLLGFLVVTCVSAFFGTIFEEKQNIKRRKYLHVFSWHLVSNSIYQTSIWKMLSWWNEHTHFNIFVCVEYYPDTSIDRRWPANGIIASQHKGNPFEEKWNRQTVRPCISTKCANKRRQCYVMGTLTHTHCMCRTRCIFLLLFAFFP